MAGERLSFVEPMKAALAGTPPEGDWLYEPKFDGIRALAVKNGTEVALRSRTGKFLNDRFPSLVLAIAHLPRKACVLDGEVCVLDDRGRSSFQLLQEAREDRPPVYYVFDLLFENGRDLRSKTLLERKDRLEAILLKDAGPIRRSACFLDHAAAVLGEFEAFGLEGAIAKRADSVYESGRRSGAWRKIKFGKKQEFVIGGYTRPKSGKREFGALLLGYFRDGRLRYAGKVGTGWTDRLQRQIGRQLRGRESPECPFADGRPKGKGRSDTHWVRPELVAQVRFAEWTAQGLLRQPSFEGLRKDKSPQEVVRESPRAFPPPRTDR